MRPQALRKGAYMGATEAPSPKAAPVVGLWRSAHPSNRIRGANGPPGNGRAHGPGGRIGKQESEKPKYIQMHIEGVVL